jgi:hypothetical protein
LVISSEQELTMKTIAAIASSFAVTLSGTAFAQVGGVPEVAPVVVPLAMPDPPPGNSEPGIQRYTDNPGRQQATEVGAQCGSGAGSGSFGYFGKDNNLGIKSDPADPGANGQQTGINNSAVCGNRQGNLP